jgi:hypothetical protein
MTTVFMLDGFGFSGFMPLTRLVQDLGGTRVQVPYNNQLGNNLPAVTAAVQTLDTYLNNPTYAGPKIVVGISMGTQVALKWQRDIPPTIPETELSFLHLASPENRFTGAAFNAPKIYGGGYGGRGLPKTVTYKNTFFNRQYDGVCDYPNIPKPRSVAIQNAMLGMAFLHINYFTVRLTDPNNVSYVETNPNGTQNIYMWSPTYPLPMVPGTAVNDPSQGFWQQLFGLKALQRQRDKTFADDQRYRTQVELSYDRPVYIPDP